MKCFQFFLIICILSLIVKSLSHLIATIEKKILFSCFKKFVTPKYGNNCGYKSPICKSPISVQT